MNALALLALLTEGPTILEGDRGEVVKKAVARLIETQDKVGCYGGQAFTRFMYNHAPAARALAEYAILAGEEKRLRPSLEMARDFIVRAQSPVGGWRYGIRPKDSDTSVTYWTVMALDRLRRAGVAVDRSVQNKAAGWVLSVTDRASGRTGYTETGSGPARLEDIIETFTPDRSEALTAAAFVVRHVVGIPGRNLDARQLKLIRGVLPLATLPDMYYWHTGLEAFALSGQPVPERWFAACVRGVAHHRRPSGAIEPAGPWGREGGVVYATAICVLALRAPSTEPAAGTAASASDFRRTGHRRVEVPAGDGAVGTAIYLDEGESVVIEPSGKVVCCRRAGETGAGGLPRTPKGRKKWSRSGGPFGCLLAGIGPDGKPTAIKKRKTFRAKRPGELHFRLNMVGSEGARGSFSVEIRQTK